ncbi:MAG: Coenzyme F420 hydrogenase/dehydrogenase, beta subunit C-terminal domain [Desulfobacula sp.]|uniref:Coenzyme F420 hydrogenase/dehydrogenase, beta subunit C-terminal domain n=1 Tax=Desulfobacula sp. TaxID=2593537 RepID=UPI0025B7B6A1|nr:Coenzyme F420 hydrogenase/dehydrogenase, beta subunit C-terminal domain [Desulfobacula sp.]MCD4719453.1 Coenzyme F420 hydrogenase/dehydrogenase, beta subunit C-terminal domain [Desulfobacula sp.]
MKKTFSHLIQDVQEQGKCNHCGGCVTFCSAVNYGALDIDENGKPCFSNIDKCLECGLCYSICPQTNELDEEIKQNAKWQEPLGNIIGISITRAKDNEIRQNGTDGGVVTAVLTHLFDSGRIDGAVVSRNTWHGRIPCLAKTKQEIINSAGSHFNSSQGMVQFAREYSTFSPSIKALSELRFNSLDRLAFVGTPCQIIAIRKMQALHIVPSDSIAICFGLFCSGNFFFNDTLFKNLEKEYQFQYDDIEKINIKDDFIFSLSSGKQIHIPVDKLAPVKRSACNFCKDFSAEYADISFGGLGAENGWTTAITRTSIGKAVFAAALEKVLVSYRVEDNPKYVTQAEKKIFAASERKKQLAQQNLADRETSGIRVIS